MVCLFVLFCFYQISYFLSGDNKLDRRMRGDWSDRKKMVIFEHEGGHLQGQVIFFPPQKVSISIMRKSFRMNRCVWGGGGSNLFESLVTWPTFKPAKGKSTFPKTCSRTQSDFFFPENVLLFLKKKKSHTFKKTQTTIHENKLELYKEKRICQIAFLKTNREPDAPDVLKSSQVRFSTKR